MGTYQLLDIFLPVIFLLNLSSYCSISASIKILTLHNLLHPTTSIMQTLNGGYSPGFLPTTNTQDAFFNDWNTQMAITEASRRLSRAPSQQRNAGAARVTKPSSASTSPRAPMYPSRRRTTVSGQYRQQQMRTDLTSGRSSRPVSWHPNTFYTPQPYMHQQASCYPFSTPNMYSDQGMDAAYPHLSPMMTSYSNNVSPVSSFSPLPLQYQNQAPQYLSPNTWAAQHTGPYYSSSNQLYSEQPPALIHAPGSGMISDNSSTWGSYMNNGISRTTPPTPDSFVNPQQPQPAVSEDLPAALDDEEDEGEILVGMGLYDTPEKYQPEDPQLNNYRSTVSSLLGSTFRAREPTGKGLTLEQAWEPPKSDDEDEDEEQEEEANDA